MTYRSNQLPLSHMQMDAMKICYHNPSMVATACGTSTNPPARYTGIAANVTCKNCEMSGLFQAFKKSHEATIQRRVAELLRKAVK